MKLSLRRYLPRAIIKIPMRASRSCANRREEPSNGELRSACDIRRGVEDTNGEVRLDEQQWPRAVFAPTERLAADPALRFNARRVFLGLVGGTIEMR
jgi:hypothetical protein